MFQTITYHPRILCGLKLFLLSLSCLVMSDSLRPHGLQPTRLLCPWDFPGKSTGVGGHCRLQTYNLGGYKITADGGCSHEIKIFAPLKKNYDNLDSVLKSRDVTLLTKVHLVKSMVFPSSHVWMWELDHKEGWVPKNWCFWTVVFEKTLESPMDCKEIQPF